MSVTNKPHTCHSFMTVTEPRGLHVDVFTSHTHVIHSWRSRNQEVYTLTFLRQYFYVDSEMGRNGKGKRRNGKGRNGTGVKWQRGEMGMGPYGKGQNGKGAKWQRDLQGTEYSLAFVMGREVFFTYINQKHMLGILWWIYYKCKAEIRKIWISNLASCTLSALFKLMFCKMQWI
jgi:hypothetical protein